MIAACACTPVQDPGTTPTDRGHLTAPTPVVAWTAHSDGAGALVTLHGGGLRDTLFVAASADGTVAAMMLDSEKPGVVAVLRQTGTAWHVDQLAGNLLRTTSPLVGRASDDDHAVIDDLAGGAHYTVPALVTLADAGLPSTPQSSHCCGWWESTTLWRTAGHGLLRATTPPLGTWSVLDYYDADHAERHWRVALTDGIVDAATSGDRVFVQLADGKLVAYRTDTGAEVWRVTTAATLRSKGAIVIDDDGGRLVTIVRNAAGCEICEQAEVHDTATGKLVRAVALRDASILSRFGERGVEKTLGLSRGGLWFRYASRGGGADSLKVAACTYQRWSLDDGALQRVQLADELARCTTPLRLVPIRGGVLGIQALDAEHAELTRLERAP